MVDTTVRNRHRNSKIRRTPRSCDRCKKRKTKCIDPIPGPCQYCSSIGATCGLDAERKQRPFYHVSEAEYQCSMRLLRHFLPGQELDFDNLKAIIGRIETERDEEDRTVPSDEVDNDNSNNSREPRETATQLHDETCAEKEDEVEAVEITALNNAMGCLMTDSYGNFRYIGGSSELRFNATVRTAIQGEGLEKTNMAILPPLKTTCFPPPTPESFSSLEEARTVGVVYLPERSQCDSYISTFFDEVHSIYWLFSSEQFYNALEQTYADNGATSNASWLCCLYSIFSLGCSTSEFSNATMPGSKDSSGYLALAKNMVNKVYDEATLDSVKALTLLSLALQTAGFRLTSYLYIGSAVRISYSLGLHQDKASVYSLNPAEREQSRRIWWTLFQFDQEVAVFGGNPCAIAIDDSQLLTPMPDEKKMNPGTHTPLGYLEVSISLCRLVKATSETFSTGYSGGENISKKRISYLISRLQDWQSSIPAHLRWGTAVPPTHRRPMSILHLRYWSAILMVTRPFLLFLVLHGPSQIGSTKKVQWFSEMSEHCIQAAENSLQILHRMNEENTLSGRITLDCNCIMEIVMISLLAIAWKDCSNPYREQIRLCLVLMATIDRTGWPREMLQELTTHMKEIGVIEEDGGGQEGFQNMQMDQAEINLSPPEFNFGSEPLSVPRSLGSWDLGSPGDSFPMDLSFLGGTSGSLAMLEDVINISRSSGGTSRS